MSERKVLNKYYPPDFDPSKIPRMKLPKNRQYTVRLMAPFNMRCVTCGEYIYKGKKFNARKEDVEGQDYLGVRIYRFYIKCTRCLQEISFKTDPQNTDYEIEAGATRNFMALKLAEEQAQREEDDRIEDESTNPMKLLENRTKQSKQEIELLESLEELRDLNRRQRSVDYDQMLTKFDTKEVQRQMELKQEEADEQYVRSVFKSQGSKHTVVHEEIVDGETTSDEPPQKMAKPSSNEVVHSMLAGATSTLTGTLVPSVRASNGLTDPTVISGVKSQRTSLAGLVRLKKNNVEPKPAQVVLKANTGSGLSLLGCYSGSDSDST